VRVSVTDNGPGIHAGDQEVIFDKFRQGSGTTDVLTDKPQGTGLGLADQPPDHRVLQRAVCGWKARPARGPASCSHCRVSRAIMTECHRSRPAARGLNNYKMSGGVSVSQRILIVDDEPNIVISLEYPDEEGGLRGRGGHRRGRGIAKGRRIPCPT
jgi:hypothetical protein